MPAFSEDDARTVRERYDRRLATLGPVPEALGWTKQRHVLRYAILLGHWSLRDQHVLDLGCGFGDMFDYTRRTYPGVRYTGIDLNPSLIDVGRTRYPDADLQATNIFTSPVDGVWDIAVASGLFNLALHDNWGFITETFAFLATHTRTGFAANFLSNRVDYELDDTYHADPARILELAYTYSNRVTLRNDYMPFEFTVFVDLRRTFDREHVVYPEYLPLIAAAR